MINRWKLHVNSFASFTVQEIYVHENIYLESAMVTYVI